MFSEEEERGTYPNELECLPDSKDLVSKAIKSLLFVFVLEMVTGSKCFRGSSNLLFLSTIIQPFIDFYGSECRDDEHTCRS